MSYDAATGTAVLFGGVSRAGNFGDTWTWNGHTWTGQHPATSPPARPAAAIAYDAATRTTVLFSGAKSERSGAVFVFRDTWVWA
jgi:hypothetical protein